MSYNIHHGRGVDDRLDLARVAAEIRNSGADIVGLQEVDRHWGERSYFADQAADLAQELGMRVVYGANLDLDPLDPGGPRRQYGNAILSDAPIHEWRNTLLPRTGSLEQRGLLQALVTVRGIPVRVFATHLQHNSQEERIAQIAAIREVVGTSPELVVLTGDLNARPNTPEIDAITEDLVDAWTEAGVGDGYTFPAEDPRARLDYVLHSNDVMTCSAAVLSTDGSDHLPVTADLALPGYGTGTGRPTSACRGCWRTPSTSWWRWHARSSGGALPGGGGGLRLDVLVAGGTRAGTTTLLNCSAPPSRRASG
jgi:endonuclease/exonuclease/phosphatase family metal-dependent hydrolase